MKNNHFITSLNLSCYKNIGEVIYFSIFTPSFASSMHMDIQKC